MKAVLNITIVKLRTRYDHPTLMLNRSVFFLGGQGINSFKRFLVTK